MPDASEFRFSTEKLERTFASLQPVDDSVQAAESTTHGCCSRTSISIACRADKRMYTLQLPLISKLPNESPDAPLQNRRLHVMRAAGTSPVLQVISAREGKGVAEIVVNGTGPAQCPPGVTNRVQLAGAGSALRDMPFTGWTWKAPALLDDKLLAGDAREELIDLLHPFKADGLPAQNWSVNVPGCPASKLKATVVSFPDVKWEGKVTVRSEPDEASKSGFRIVVEGDLACRYGEHALQIDSIELAKALSPWMECVEPLARCAAATMALRPSARYSGYDTPLLEKNGDFRWQPWPQISLRITSELFEQKGNGLLGHFLSVRVSGDPLIGARGEISLLPKWLQEAKKNRLLSPMLAGIDARRIEEITQELGLWLVADGETSMEARLEARRPDFAPSGQGRAGGAVRLEVQPRSTREYDAIVVRCGGRG